MVTSPGARLAEQRQIDWEEEQGGFGFVRELSSEAALVAAKAAEWSRLVLVQIRAFLPRATRLEAVRVAARERAIRRRQNAAKEIREGRRGLGRRK